MNYAQKEFGMEDLGFGMNSQGGTAGRMFFGVLICPWAIGCAPCSATVNAAAAHDDTNLFFTWMAASDASYAQNHP